MEKLTCPSSPLTLAAMNDSRRTKDLLYEQVARIGKAACSPKRLELIELLCQGEKSVETLARETAISMKLASAHLRELRAAHLVETEKQGKNVIYRIANRAVADFWVAIRSLAEDRLVELRLALEQMTSHPKELAPQDRDGLVKLAKKGEVVVLDVRPATEYAAAHLPFARSIPIDELRQRLAELPAGKTVVAYCRGPYCLMARDAVDLLRQEGFKALHLPEGVAEWGISPVRST